MFGNLRISHVEFRFPGSEKLGPAGMVEWNGIFRLFRFSGILGQPREVHRKFRNGLDQRKVVSSVLITQSEHHILTLMMGLTHLTCL